MFDAGSKNKFWQELDIILEQTKARLEFEESWNFIKQSCALL